MKTSQWSFSLLLGCVTISMTWVPTAFAATCTINGIARECDFTCPGGANSTCNPEKSHANCDDDGDADGFCVICGTASGEFIFGTEGDDWICAKGGNDTIFSYDAIHDGQSEILGDDTVDGSSGDDLIRTAAGDNDVLGGTGNDEIIDWAGANALSGGANDDEITQVNASGSTPGGHFCGGEGSDRIEVNATNNGFYCIDCGDGQVATGTDYDVEFVNFLTGNNTGSALNCVNPQPSADLFTPPVPCGCRD